MARANPLPAPVLTGTRTCHETAWWAGPAETGACHVCGGPGEDLGVAEYPARLRMTEINRSSTRAVVCVSAAENPPPEYPGLGEVPAVPTFPKERS